MEKYKKVIQKHGSYKAPTWNETFDLADGSHSVSDIQDCFENILKKHGQKTDNPLMRIL